ncbi:hypothetical protein GCM10010201_36520 [Pilimelia columellifera subsp. columellifera]|uniref:Uncharacterized protein n=1 Tax=Pilimelia columellifera subsp. columellifera TaxID=706583 RepID=A0ABP6B5L6_9ACTN
MPASGLDYPGASQVFRIRRDTYNLSRQRVSKDLTVGVTTLTSPAAAVAAHVQHHWGIEATSTAYVTCSYAKTTTTLLGDTEDADVAGGFGH